MNRTACFLAGCACDHGSELRVAKPDANTQSAAKPDSATVPLLRSGAAGPFEIVTQSGVGMVALPGGEFLMGSAQGNADERPAAQGAGQRVPDRQVRGDARDVDEGAIAQSLALAGQSEETCRARALARCQAILQRALAPGKIAAVLQRENHGLGLRLCRERLSPAHRGGMGIRGASRDGRAI